MTPRSGAQLTQAALEAPLRVVMPPSVSLVVLASLVEQLLLVTPRCELLAVLARLVEQLQLVTPRSGFLIVRLSMVQRLLAATPPGELLTRQASLLHMAMPPRELPMQAGLRLVSLLSGAMPRSAARLVACIMCPQAAFQATPRNQCSKVMLPVGQLSKSSLSRLHMGFIRIQTVRPHKSSPLHPRLDRVEIHRVPLLCRRPPRGTHVEVQLQT